MSSNLSYPDHIASLKPYVAGMPIANLAKRLQVPEREIAKLASNENPLGASRMAVQALQQASLDLSRYPDSDTSELSDALAQYHGIPSDWIVTGAGSEALLGNAVATLLQAGAKTAFSEFSFQAYANACQRVGAVSIVTAAPSYKVDLAALAKTVDHHPALIYIANPGNPTGTALEPVEILRFLRTIPREIVVLLDEAYFEFLPPALRTDSVQWVHEFSNLLVTRTFSKAYGLAGLRVGYAIAQPELAGMLRRVRSPFTVSAAAQVAAIAALQDQDFLERTLDNNQVCRNRLCAALEELGFPFLPSHTSFVLVKVGSGIDFTQRIERHKIIIRPVVSYRLPEWVRISIGTPEETDRLIEALKIECRSESAVIKIAG